MCYVTPSRHVKANVIILIFPCAILLYTVCSIANNVFKACISVSLYVNILYVSLCDYTINECVHITDMYASPLLYTYNTEMSIVERIAQ